MTLEEKIEQSIRIIKKLYNPNMCNNVAFSGGKDSIVIYDLCKKSGLKFSYTYANTTIDPPNHLGFIRKNYSDVKISRPKQSFYQLIANRGLPTRMSRFCCQTLKEYIGNDCKNIEGLRIDEGVKRGKRLKAITGEPEQCDTRVKGKIHVYPIMNWTKKDVWDYIKSNNLPYPDLYDRGYNRLGCVGCPLASPKQRIFEYKDNPRYVYATIKAIKKNIDNKKSLSKFFDDPYEAFYWWLSKQPLKKFKENQLFEIDYEKIIKETFKIK